MTVSGGRAVGTVMVVTAALSWGTWSLFVRPSNAPPWVAAALPLLLMGLFTLPLVALDRRPLVWNRRTVWLVIGMGALAGCNLLTFFAAMTVTTVAIATLTHYAAPLLVALLAPRLENERIRGAPLAAAVGLVGLALIMVPGGDGGAGRVWLGGLLGFASAVSYALLVFVVRRLGPRIGEARVISYQGLVAGLLLAPFAVPELGAIDAGMVGYLSIGALVPGAVGGLLFVRGLERVGSSRAAVLAFAEPVCAVAIGWMFWNEGLGPLAAVGAACIVVAGVWVSRSPATYSTDSV